MNIESTINFVLAASSFVMSILWALNGSEYWWAGLVSGFFCLSMGVLSSKK